MAESINRDIATSVSAAVKADNITSTGEVSASIQVLDSAGLLPTSGVTAGERAFTSDSNGYYIHNGSGWFKIGLINTNPSITAVNDSDGNALATGFALSKPALRFESQSPQQILKMFQLYSVLYLMLDSIAWRLFLRMGKYLLLRQCPKILP